LREQVNGNASGTVQEECNRSVQHQLTEAIEIKMQADVLGCKDAVGKEQAALAKACAKKGAGRWLCVMPNGDPHLSMSAWEYCQAVRLFLGVRAVEDGRCVKHCGVMLEDAESDHLFRCKQLRAYTNVRHDAVLIDGVQALARRAGLMCSLKLKRQFSASAASGPDAIITGPGMNAWVDVTVHLSSVDGSEADGRHKSKRAKYVGPAGREDGALCVFGVEAHGFVGGEAANLIEQMGEIASRHEWRVVADPKRFVAHAHDVLAVSIQRGNARQINVIRSRLPVDGRRVVGGGGQVYVAGCGA
jgi:hypothetical protein